MTILFVLMGSMMIGIVVALLSEKWGWTHNGILPSCIIAMGAVLLFFMIRVMFGWSFGSPGLDSVIGSVAALALLPTEIAHKRREKNRKSR